MVASSEVTDSIANLAIKTFFVVVFSAWDKDWDDKMLRKNSLDKVTIYRRFQQIKEKCVSRTYQS
jgi:hypothetical protein